MRRLEGEAAVGRSRALSLEGAVRVKEREIERLTRVLEAAKVSPFCWWFLMCGHRGVPGAEGCLPTGLLLWLLTLPQPLATHHTGR